MRTMNGSDARVAILRGDDFTDGLTVKGYLDLSGCTGLTALPDGLTVDGSLYLSGCCDDLICAAYARGLIVFR